MSSRQVEWLAEARENSSAGHMDAAAQCYRQVLLADPFQIEALIGLADALKALDRNSEVITLLEECVRQMPGSALLCSRFADALQIQGDLARAIECYRQAVMVDGTLPATWWGLGCAQATLGNHVQAVESFQSLLLLQPEHGKGLINLGLSLFELGQIDSAIDAIRKSVDLIPAQLRDVPLMNIALMIPGSPTATNQDILEARRAWALQCLPPGPIDRKFSDRIVDRRRPLRLGYVSAFFNKCNWMKPVWGLLDHHDHDRFEVHVFSDGPEPDPRYGYHQNPRHSFHNVELLSNADLARFIEDRAIDLLVDLNGFSQPSRLELYTLRPSPVQIVWFNMFAPSGMACFDHLIGNAHVITTNEEIYYSEPIVRSAGKLLDIPGPVPRARRLRRALPEERILDVRLPGSPVQDHDAGG